MVSNEAQDIVPLQTEAEPNSEISRGTETVQSVKSVPVAKSPTQFRQKPVALGLPKDLKKSIESIQKYQQKMLKVNALSLNTMSPTKLSTPNSQASKIIAAKINGEVPFSSKHEASLKSPVQRDKREIVPKLDIPLRQSNTNMPQSDKATLLSKL